MDQKRGKSTLQPLGIEGRKIIKTEETEPFPSQVPDYRPFIKEKFDGEQIESLIQHLKELQKYYQFVSYEIEHQERSIATLPTSVLTRFPEIRNRVKSMVDRAKQNVSFLDQVLMPYKPLVLQHMLAQKDEQPQQHCHHNHNITNMFLHIVREWSETPEINHIKRAILYLEQYAALQRSQGKSRILVVGSGMGRILHQIVQRFKNIQIQGHESDTQKYLCSQYFLNRCTRSQPIYPYIHNFTNFLQDKDPYRGVKVPFKVDTHTSFYPLTLGDFPILYSAHSQCWNIIITMLYSQNISNVLHYIRLIHRMLREGGIWIDCSTSNFNSNILPMTYGEYQAILDKSQFKLLSKSKEEGFYLGDSKSLMNEKRVHYYRVMQK